MVPDRRITLGWLNVAVGALRAVVLSLTVREIVPLNWLRLLRMIVAFLLAPPVISDWPHVKLLGLASMLKSGRTTSIVCPAFILLFALPLSKTYRVGVKPPTAE